MLNIVFDVYTYLIVFLIRRRPILCAKQNTIIVIYKSEYSARLVENGRKKKQTKQ